MKGHELRLSKRITGAFITAAIVCGGVMSAPSAGASVASGSISGADWGNAGVRNDWGDEGPLDYNSHDYSRAVALWQLVLRAEGFYTGAIDCDFGPATTEATRDFQRWYGLTADGSAGPNTLSVADNSLQDLGNQRDIRYIAWEGMGSVDFRRINGVYHFYLNGAWRTASYTSASGC
ncbi:peptidoglycan-binding domain-containing protein [Streptomyces cadmiisoli]|uniref:peptidoglycan-binding domain-containing protein n=1 Tax=Streptomyces cadmiisoli TaxID=2184053 RepID=UPI0013A6DAE6|nr:peptidoglycan-binding domain-containing protein [Streptomyces cadmiisoli]